MPSRFSGLGAALSNVADKLRKEREMGMGLGIQRQLAGEEFGRKQQLLGSEEASRMRLLEKEAQLRPREPKEWKPTTKGEAIEFEGVKLGLKPKLTLAGALGIISDPMKAMQTKKTYPNLYAEAERIVKKQLGEDILTKVSPTNKLKTPGKLPTKTSIFPTEDIMDTNW